MVLNEYLKLPYTIRLRRDQDGDWVARVEELKGCTAHGSTESEALTELEQAKHEWLQAALEDGIPIPAPAPEEPLPSGKWLQRVPRSLHRELVQLAKAEGTSLNQLVTSILTAHVGAAGVVWGTTITSQGFFGSVRQGPDLITHYRGGGPQSGMTSTARIAAGPCGFGLQLLRMNLDEILRTAQGTSGIRQGEKVNG